MITNCSQLFFVLQTCTAKHKSSCINNKYDFFGERCIYRLNGIELWCTTCKGQKYYLLSNNQIHSFLRKSLCLYYLQKKHIKCVYRLSIQRNIAYKGQKYSLFYKQRGTYFEVQSICCTAAFYMTIEYMNNQVCNSMYCKSYVMHNTDTCQNISLLT